MVRGLVSGCIFLFSGGFGRLAIGYWLLAFGFWLLAFGDWRLALGFWLLAKSLPIAISLFFSPLYFICCKSEDFWSNNGEL